MNWLKENWHIVLIIAYPLFGRSFIDPATFFICFLTLVLLEFARDIYKKFALSKNGVVIKIQGIPFLVIGFIGFGFILSLTSLWLAQFNVDQFLQSDDILKYFFPVFLILGLLKLPRMIILSGNEIRIYNNNIIILELDNIESFELTESKLKIKEKNRTSFQTIKFGKISPHDHTKLQEHLGSNI